jgi:hypothetical protein
MFAQDTAPFVRVTVGTPIVTADFERLGTVKGIHGAYFRVKAGLLHRDYWLPATTVDEAVPDEVVVLTVTKAQVDEYKSYRDPHEAA